MRVEYRERDAYLIFPCASEACDGNVEFYTTNQPGEYPTWTQPCDECGATHALHAVKTGEAGEGR